MTDIKVVVDSSDLQLLKRELIDIPKKAKDSASVFEREFNKVEKRLNNVAKSSQDYYNQILRVDSVNKSAAQSASVFERELEQEVKSLDAVRRSIDPVYAAKQRTIQVTQSLRAAVDSEQMSVEEAAHTLRLYRQQLKLNNEMQMAATKAANRFGVVTQQAGYQVSDFIVQVQSGTNPFIAFSQQASQLAGVLPLVASGIGLTTTAAIALSAALGVVIPLVGAIGAAWLISRENSDEATAGTDSFTRALENARARSAELREELSMLANGYKDTAEAAFGAAVDQARAQLQQDKADLARKVEAAKVGGGVGASLAKAAANRVSQSEKALEAAEGELEAYRKLRDFHAREKEAFNDITGTVQGLNDAQEALNGKTKANIGNIDKVESSYKDVLGSTEGLSAAEGALNDIYKSRIGTIDDTANNYKDVLGSAEGLKAAQDGLNKKFEDGLGKIDETANSYEDVIGSVEGLQDALTAVLEIEEARQTAIAEGLVGGLEAQIQTANEFYDVAQTEQQELNDLAGELGERLGIAFGTAIKLIRQAKAEATIGLDAFGDPNDNGGYGSFKYGVASSFNPNKGKGRGGKKKETASEYLKSLMDEAKYKRSIIGLSEEEQRVQEILYQAKKKELVLTKEQAQAVAKIEEETRRLQQTQELYDSIQGHLENGFMSLIDGSKSVAEAFKDMIRNILLEIYKQKVAKPLADIIISAFSANGNVFNAGGGLTAFANGGVVNSPTLFGYSGGTGLMGEAGPEAIMPLKRGSNGKLGVSVEGGGGVTVVQNINVSTGVQATVRSEIRQLMPQIAESAKGAVLDAKRRGGNYGRGMA